MSDPRRSGSRRRAAVLAALLVGLAAPPLAGETRAQVPPAPSQPAAGWTKVVMLGRQRAAGKLFEEARRDRDAGMIGKAAGGYRAALAYWEDPIIRYELALVLIELRDPVAAYDQLDRMIQGGRAGIANARVYEHAVAMRQKLLEHELAHLLVTCWANGARISIDNDEAGAWIIQTRASAARPAIITQRVRVRAGLHTILAELPGGHLVPVQRRVRAGETVHVTVAVPMVWRRRWENMQWAPWALSSAGLLLWAVGSTLQHSADATYRRAGEVVEACTRDGASCDPGRVTFLRDLAGERRTLGLVGYGLAGAAVVTGGVLAYLNRRVARPATAAWPIQPRCTSVAPLVGPGLGGAVVTGRF
jgi:hypothetical protein